MKREAELRRLKDTWDQETLTDKHFEVEVIHNGHSTFHWARLRRIMRAVETVDGRTATAEVWETVERGSRVPTKVTVEFAGDTGLREKCSYVNYMHTAHGSKIVTSTVMAGLVFLDLLLIMLMTGSFAVEPDLTQWYFIGPVCAIAGIVVPLLIISERSVAGIITIECADPEHEEANHHVGYACHCPNSNTLRELDAATVALPAYTKAIETLGDKLTARNDYYLNRIAWLEAESQRLCEEGNSSDGQKISNLVLTPGKASQLQRYPSWMYGVLIVCSVAIGAAITWVVTKGG